MKKLLLLLTFLILVRISGDNCNAVCVPAETTAADFGESSSEVLEAKPILFIKRGLHQQSLELQESSSSNKEEIVKEKMLKILNDLIKKYGACAVQLYDYYYSILYLDPAYDITKEAFDRLNKEYLESK